MSPREVHSAARRAARRANGDGKRNVALDRYGNKLFVRAVRSTPQKDKLFKTLLDRFVEALEAKLDLVSGGAAVEEKAVRDLINDHMRAMRDVFADRDNPLKPAGRYAFGDGGWPMGDPVFRLPPVFGNALRARMTATVFDRLTTGSANVAYVSRTGMAAMTDAARATKADIEAWVSSGGAAEYQRDKDAMKRKGRARRHRDAKRGEL